MYPIERLDVCATAHVRAAGSVASGGRRRRAGQHLSALHLRTDSGEGMAGDHAQLDFGATFAQNPATLPVQEACRLVLIAELAEGDAALAEPVNARVCAVSGCLGDMRDVLALPRGLCVADDDDDDDDDDVAPHIVF
jgi:hypothetical protein